MFCPYTIFIEWHKMTLNVVQWSAREILIEFFSDRASPVDKINILIYTISNIYSQLISRFRKTQVQWLGVTSLMSRGMATIHTIYQHIVKSRENTIEWMISFTHYWMNIFCYGVYELIVLMPKMPNVHSANELNSLKLNPLSIRSSKSGF